MIKVKFLVDTAYKGPRHEGDIVDVPSDYAKRWAKNGIATIIEEEKKDDVKEKSLEEMNAKELYALCKERGVEAEAKMPKKYYLEKLA